MSKGYQKSSWRNESSMNDEQKKNLNKYPKISSDKFPTNTADQLMRITEKGPPKLILDCKICEIRKNGKPKDT